MQTNSSPVHLYNWTRRVEGLRRDAPPALGPSRRDTKNLRAGPGEPVDRPGTVPRRLWRGADICRAPTHRRLGRVHRGVDAPLSAYFSPSQKTSPTSHALALSPRSTRGCGHEGARASGSLPGSGPHRWAGGGHVREARGSRRPLHFLSGAPARRRSKASPPTPIPSAPVGRADDREPGQAAASSRPLR